MTRTTITKILKLADELFEATGKELRVTLKIGKKVDPEYNVWIQEEQGHSLPDILYLPYDEAELLERIKELVQTKIEEE